jgi:flagellar biosynthesis/type III secretory pathway chaperone
MEKQTDQNEMISTPRERLHQSLQDLIGLHRQLYEVIKSENEAITHADIKATYDAAAAKEALIHWIHQAEMSRQSVVYLLCTEEGISTQKPSLRDLILHYQARDPEITNKLQTDLNSLIVLVERIKKQNELNAQLVDASLKHIGNMKRNIFGEVSHQGRTYNQMGQTNKGSTQEQGPRLISKEV